MKLLISLLLLLPLVIPPTPQDPVVEWTMDTTYDFGLLNQGNPATIVFPFKNISDTPITIDNVRVSCGCTAPTWDFAPIEPDSTGILTIEYDSMKYGYFYKKIKVFFSNQRKPEILWIEGEVE